MTNVEELFSFLGTRGYSGYLLQGLRLLTRDMWPGLTYINYVRNIVASGHRGAMWVKYMDNRQNTDPVRTARLPEEEQKRAAEMRGRYERSMAILKAGLGQ
jgi:hypothetical protein